MSSQVFSNGSFFYARMPCEGPADSPVNHPDKWQELAIPADMALAVAMQAAAGILQGTAPERADAMAASAAGELVKQIGEANRKDGLSRSLRVTDRG
jgi:hypothetical protein